MGCPDWGTGLAGGCPTLLLLLKLRRRLCNLETLPVLLLGVWVGLGLLLQSLLLLLLVRLLLLVWLLLL